MRRSRPDNRLDWRDPAMPALRAYEIMDSTGRVVKAGTEEIAPEVVQQVAQDDVESADFPRWWEDPSYFWSKRRAKPTR